MPQVACPDGKHLLSSAPSEPHYHPWQWVHDVASDFCLLSTPSHSSAKVTGYKCSSPESGSQRVREPALGTTIASLPFFRAVSAGCTPTGPPELPTAWKGPVPSTPWHVAEWGRRMPSLRFPLIVTAPHSDHENGGGGARRTELQVCTSLESFQGVSQSIPGPAPLAAATDGHSVTKVATRRKPFQNRCVCVCVMRRTRWILPQLYITKAQLRQQQGTI